MERLSNSQKGAGWVLGSLLLLALQTGCGSGPGPHSRLVDGSRPASLPGALRSVHGRVIATKVSVTTLRAAGRRLRACVHRFSPARFPPGATVVERTGLFSSGATFRSGAWVYGCDATAGPKESAGPWCATAVGRTRSDGTLFDPRVDILCRDAGKHFVGLAWIEPVAGARYVVLRDRGYAEAYEVAGGLPVRVATHDVDVETSSATFRVEQYDAHGFRLARRTLRAEVAG